MGNAAGNGGSTSPTIEAVMQRKPNTLNVARYSSGARKIERITVQGFAARIVVCSAADINAMGNNARPTRSPGAIVEGTHSNVSK